MIQIRDGRFAIASNGFADGPAQALRDFLVKSEAAKVTTIAHPLVPGDAGRHEIAEWTRGSLTRRRTVRLPSRPPTTYLFDLLVPVAPPAVDAWFGFNCLAASRGLAARHFGRARRVIYWCVDFVPARFGRSPVTTAYDALDRLCCRRADARFELSKAACEAREARHRRLGHPLAPARVVPMGAWLDRSPTTAPDGYISRRVVYLGHLVPRQGVGILLEAMALLRQRGIRVTADIIGRGELLDDLQQAAAATGLSEVVTFHGFIEDHRRVEELLASAAIGVAPYLEDPESFTRFADPGKLKAYLGAGLPIIMTPVPPNADALAESGAATIVPARPDALAGAIENLLAEPAQWASRRAAALELARQYDWSTILSRAMAAVGFASSR